MARAGRAGLAIADEGARFVMLRQAGELLLDEDAASAAEAPTQALALRPHDSHLGTLTLQREVRGPWRPRAGRRCLPDRPRQAIRSLRFRERNGSSGRADLFVFYVLVSCEMMQAAPCSILLAAVAATMMSCGPAPGTTSEPGETAGPSSSGEAGAMFPTESSTDEPPICHGEPMGVWEAIPDAPESRYVATGVWTGQEVLVWGGLKDFEGDFASQGLRYKPATKTWDFISDVDAPIGRSAHVAMWTGTEMLVWGGAITVGEPPNHTFDFRADGGRYDPVTDTWKGVSDFGAPTARIFHRIVWTGDRVLIWGGNNYNEGHLVNTGGSYDPVLDVWTAISLEGAPSPRDGHALVWTGQEMFVWGGTGLSDGGLYDPATDTWRPVSTIGQPAPLRLPFGAWTGEHVLIYSTFSLNLTEEVGVLHRYDPAQDLWLPEIVLCDQRAMASLAWTGSDILAWGGFLQCGEEGCPVADNILRIPPGGGDVSANVPGQPDYRSSHVYLWIDGGLWVWGGTAPNPVATGGVYWPGS